MLLIDCIHGENKRRRNYSVWSRLRVDWVNEKKLSLPVSQKLINFDEEDLMMYTYVTHVKHESSSPVSCVGFSFIDHVSFFRRSVDDEIIIMRCVMTTHAVVGDLHEFRVTVTHVSRQACNCRYPSVYCLDDGMTISREPGCLTRSSSWNFVGVVHVWLHFRSLKSRSSHFSNLLRLRVTHEIMEHHDVNGKVIEFLNLDRLQD